MRQYRKSKDASGLIAAAAAALYPREHDSLRAAFRKHVPNDHHVVFDAKVEALREAAAARNVPEGVATQGGTAVSGSDGAAGAAGNAATHAPGNRKTAGKVPGSAPRTFDWAGAGSMKAFQGRAAARQMQASTAIQAVHLPSANAHKSAAPASQRSTKSMSGGQQGRFGPPCPKCGKSPQESPHQSRCCGRVACYSCWLSAVALHACPECKKPLKKSMLSKKYFM